MTVSETSAQYVVVGASHRSSALSLRGRLLVDEAAIPHFIARLQARGLDDVLVLSTVDRIEVIAAAGEPAAAAESIKQILAEQAGVEKSELQGQLHTFTGDAAVRHVFAAAAGLDSLVPGDADVALRLRSALDLARQCGAAGQSLEWLIEAGLQAAARVAAETGLGARPASIAAAAVRVARDVHGDLARCTGLVVGPGDMGERLARGLVDAGLARLILTGRSATKLEEAARRLRCEVVPLDLLEAALAGADIVIANMGSFPPAITASMVSAALKQRRQKPIFLIDAAIPGDIERAAGEIEDAFLYDLADLETVVMAGGAEREEAAASAADIVAGEAARFIAGSAKAEGEPDVALLRRRFEAARNSVLEETPQGDAAAATRSLVDRLLPQVAALVREAARRGAGNGKRNDETAARPIGKKDGTP